jgi:hypothetical protein
MKKTKEMKARMTLQDSSKMDLRKRGGLTGKSVASS